MNGSLYSKHHTVFTVGILVLVFWLAISATAGAEGIESPDAQPREIDQGWSSHFRPYGDFRVRAGVEARIDDNWSAVVAVRSGPDLSQQSPHITIVDFDDGPAGPYEFNLDLWYLKYESGGFNAWIGRNTMSFWHQDDLFISTTYPTQVWAPATTTHWVVAG